ncbi:MAG: glutathione S-transferase [Alphaproteobacteria bacterium]
MLTLYDYELSGNCYKVRLLLHFCGLDYRTHKVDFYPGRAHKTPEFLALNPLGQLPVIDDGGVVVRDAQAILIHIAARYDASRRWWPADRPARLGPVAQWLAFADSISSTAGAARLHAGFFYDLDVEAARAGALRLFRILDEHLWFAERAGDDWLVPGNHPTIADIACFPYVVLSEEGGIARQDYPAIRRWTDRFKRIPGFVVMAGVLPASPGR